jgi:hypothetical protein
LLPSGESCPKTNHPNNLLQKLLVLLHMHP